jgi:hypothetical protein
MDQLDAMMAWGNGELNDEEVVELFQNLLNSGLVYQLQGCYGRFAQQLINAGLIG